ncbi:MAG: tyrosine protein kinase [Tannerellaceae bacterium]|nr:tyrosine protein kinase [Tannerellaceae bacterium]
MEENKDKETIELKKIIINYFLYWKFFIAVFIVSLIFALLYLIYYPRTYEVMARIQILEDTDLIGGPASLGDASGLMKSFGLGSKMNAGVNLDDELAILNSNSLMSEMVKELGIYVTYSEPFSFFCTLYKTSPILFIPDSYTEENLDEEISFKVKGNKDFITIHSKSSVGKQTFQFNDLPAHLEIGEYKFTLTFNDHTPGNQKINLEISIRPASWVAEDLLNTFTIEEYSKTSNIIELIYTDYDKKRARDMVNTLISAYNQHADVIKKQEADSGISFLDNRINDIVDNLNKIEKIIEDYKTKNKLTNIEYDIQFYGEQIKEFQIKMIELEAQSHIVTLLEEYIKAPENKYKLIPMLLSMDEGEKGSPLSMYNEALLERTRILSNSERDNPLVHRLEEQIVKLRETVIQTIQNTSVSLHLSLVDLQTKEKLLIDKLGDYPTQEKEYVELRRQQEIFQGMYLILLQKREEIALKEATKEKARIVDTAFIKENPVAPRKLYAAFGVLFFTLFIPVSSLFIGKQFLSLRAEFLSRKK